MSAYYDLYLELSPEPKWDDALREFLSAMGLAEAISSITPAGIGGNAYWEEPYCYIDSGPVPEGTYPRERLREELGISINFSFGFDFKDSPWLPGILRGVDHFLGKYSGDAVFLFNGEIVKLMRRGGQLYLNNAPGMWTPYWLQFITQPYEMIKIPVL